MEEEREYLVLPEVNDIESAKSELVLGLRLLSFSGANLFDRQTLMYEINIAKCLDESKMLSEDSHQRYHQVVIEAFKNNALPLNEQGQASVDDIINVIDIKFNALNIEEPIEEPALGKERQSLGGNYEDSSVSSGSKRSSVVEQVSEEKKSSNKSSMNAVPEVFRVSILKQEDKEALDRAAKNYYSHIFSGKNKAEDRSRLINLAAFFLVNNPALSHHIEQVLRDNKPKLMNIREIDKLMIDIHSQFDASQKTNLSNEQKDKKDEAKFEWFDKSSFSKDDQYLLEKFERAEVEYISSVVTPSTQTEPNRDALIDAGVELVNNHENKQQALVEIEAKLRESSILTKDAPPLAEEIMRGIVEKLESGASYGK